MSVSQDGVLHGGFLFAGGNRMPAMEILAVLSLAGFLWLIAVTSKEQMQMIWLGLVVLILLSPILALIWPAFR